MRPVIIGRTAERAILDDLLESRQSDLLAIYGRRRVGKTYLIKTHYEDKLIFTCSGQLNGSTKDQLSNFDEQLSKYFPDLRRTHIPQTWQEAFKQLKQGLDSIKISGKKYYFLMSSPGWIHTSRVFFQHSNISGILTVSTGPILL